MRGEDDALVAFGGGGQGDRPGVENDGQRLGGGQLQSPGRLGRGALVVHVHSRSDDPCVDPPLAQYAFGMARRHTVGEVARPGVSDHSRAGGQGGVRAQEPGAGVAPGAGHDPEHSAGVLVRVGAGNRPHAARVLFLEADEGGLAEREADVGDFDASRVSARGLEVEPRFGRAHGHGQIAVQDGAGDGAVVGPDARGDVHGDHALSAAHARQGAHVRGEGLAQRAARPDPDESVDPHVGPAGLLELGQPHSGSQGRGEAPFVGAARDEGLDGHAAGGQAGGRVEGVASVVAAARQDEGAASVDGPSAGAHFADRRERQRPGRPLHEGLAGRQERGFGGADVGGPVGLDHRLSSVIRP